MCEIASYVGKKIESEKIQRLHLVAWTDEEGKFVWRERELGQHLAEGERREEGTVGKCRARLSGIWSE